MSESGSDFDRDEDILSQTTVFSWMIDLQETRDKLDDTYARIGEQFDLLDELIDGLQSAPTSPKNHTEA